MQIRLDVATSSTVGALLETCTFDDRECQLNCCKALASLAVDDYVKDIISRDPNRVAVVSMPSGSMYRVEL